jgi:hypothetical protein
MSRILRCDNNIGVFKALATNKIIVANFFLQIAALHELQCMPVSRQRHVLGG